MITPNFDRGEFLHDQSYRHYMEGFMEAVEKCSEVWIVTGVDAHDSCLLASFHDEVDADKYIESYGTENDDYEDFAYIGKRKIRVR